MPGIVAEHTGHRILIIEGDPSCHQEFCAAFGSPLEGGERVGAAADGGQPLGTDFKLDFAHEGEEGFRQVVAAHGEQRPFTIAFVNLHPTTGWDGLTTIKWLWEADPDLHIVICCSALGYTWSELAERLGRRDRFIILMKPFHHAEVTQLAAALIEKRRLAKEAAIKRENLERMLATRTQTLTETQQASERLINAIDSLLIDVDRSGVVRRWNRIAVDMFGIPESEVVGKRLADIGIEWEDPDALFELLDLKQQDSIQRQETAFRDRAGVSRVVGFSCYPIREADQFQGVLVLGTELTGQRELEQHLHQAQKLEAVGQLAAGVAHEINTPMQYLGDNLDFLAKKVGKLMPMMERLSSIGGAESSAALLADIQSDLNKLKVKSFLRQVMEAICDSQQGVQHVSRIVRAMKEFAHPGQEEKNPVDINRALESTIAVSTNEWKYVADVETAFDEDLPLVSALAGEINQVFLNIVVNAAHAIATTNEGGVKGKGLITVATRHTDEYVEISIADTGPGIPEDIKQRIFDPFFTTKEVGKGTGQGLAIAHSIVEQKHGGRIWCETVEGSGTTFFLQLPLVTLEQATRDESEATLTAI